IDTYISIRFWTAMPGVYLALGIFGSFLGLTLGVRGFDASGEAAIKSSIQALLSGMGTAFLTSVWGTFYSIGFNMWEKVLFGRVAKSLRAFTHTLDEKYFLTRAEKRSFEWQDNAKLLSNLFVAGSGSKEVLPSQVFREL